MRTVREIRAEITEVTRHRKDLVAEYKVAQRLQLHEMLRLFDDENMTYNAIAIRCEKSPHTVQVELHKQGRSYRLRQMRWAQDRADRLNAGELVDAEHS